MTVIYRTTGAWGPGKGAGLTPAEIDTNFWTIAQSIAAIESGSLDINSIENIVVSGSTFTIHTTRGDTFGPYSMPVAMMRPRGDWVATHPYSPLDLVSVAGDGLYVVGVAHVADATFDANRLISGEKVYTLVLQPGADGPQGIQGPAGPDGPQGIQGPAGADGAGVPVGGAAGQILSKVDGVDFNTEWVDAPSGGSTGGTAHAYWRIKITASNSATYVNLTELELRGSIGGVDQATGGTSICGSSYFGGTGTEVWDGNTTSDRWGAETNGVSLGTAWVGYHFATPVDVKQIAMTCSGFNTQAPTAFNLEWSDDGVTWTVLESFTTASVWTAYETRLFTVQSYLSLLADLDDVDMSTAPTSGQALKWNGTAWAPAADVTGGSGGTSLPTGGTTGQVLAKASNTDGDAHWVDAASGGGGGLAEGAIVKPTTGAFSAGPGSTATTFFEDSLNGVRLRDFNVTGNTNLLRYVYQAPAGTNWRVTGKFRRSLLMNFQGWGIVVANFAGNKHMVFGPKYDNAACIGRIRFGAYNSYGSADAWVTPAQPEIFWLKVELVGTTISYFYSEDGSFWTKVYEETVASFYVAAPDRVGFGMNTNHAGNNYSEPAIECLSWVNESI